MRAFSGGRARSSVLGVRSSASIRCQLSDARYPAPVAIVYGYWAAKDPTAERVLIPLLDVLQSIPVLGFMPGLVLAMTALFPSSHAGLELAAVVMIFTGQVWNMAFSWYHALRSVPRDLVEVAELYRLSAWQRLRWVEGPFATVGLVWNSMMSMAGGWFFLMVSESFVLGGRDFRVPGLGSYMSEAVARGDIRAMVLAVLAMVLMIVVLDQFLWRPVAVWSQKFRIEEVGSGGEARSWFLEWFRRSALGRWLRRRMRRVRDSGGGRMKRESRLDVLSARPARVLRVVENPLPRPRDYRDPAFLELVDYLHEVIVGHEIPDVPTPLPPSESIWERLPDASTSEIIGLLEYLDARGGRENIFRIAAETSREFGRIIAVVKAAEMLNLVETLRQMVVISSIGRRFVQAGLEERKALWREQLFRLRLFQSVWDLLLRQPDHTVDADLVREKIIFAMPEEDYERVFTTLIRWARFGNLLDYDEASNRVRIRSERVSPVASAG